MLTPTVGATDARNPPSFKGIRIFPRKMTRSDGANLNPNEALV
jgi:hypothetical protein